MMSRVATEIDRVNLWDAIIVGAGPAGCAAAYDLAASGKRVLLLDRCDFPRRKACAGGLTVKAVRALRFSVDPVVRARVSHIRVSKHLGDASLLRSSHPVCLMTVREELDTFCLAKTFEAGAQFRRIGQIASVGEEKDGVVLATAQEVLRARFLIGADGANSRVRQLSGQDNWFRRGFALETNVSYSAPTSEMSLDFGVVTDGYGWVFPKGEHVNAGLYSHSGQQGITRGDLERYLGEKLGTEISGPVIGQYLGMGGGDDQSIRRRILLVGDAAGLVDPLTGEGIYNAITSGQAAARAINDELDGRSLANELYKDALNEMRLDLALSTRGARRFYGNIDWGYSALTFPLIRNVALKTYLQGMSFGRALKRYPWVVPYLRKSNPRCDEAERRPD